MAIETYQPGIIPIGHFDVKDGDLQNILGGEVLVLDNALSTDRTVADVYKNGARTQLRLATGNDIGPFFLANSDKDTSQYTTPGFEKTSLFSSNRSFAKTIDSSSKISIFADEGFYAVSIDVVDGYNITSATLPNTRLYINEFGYLTTVPSNTKATIGFFVEYRQDAVVNNNLLRPFKTAGSFRDTDTIIFYKTNADGYVDLSIMAAAIGEFGKIGLPTDGYYSDGYLSLTTESTIADSFDSINEALLDVYDNNLPDRANVQNISMDYLISSLDGVIFANATSGTIMITLPNTFAGRRLTIKKTDVTPNTISIFPSGISQIENAASVSLTVSGESLTIVYDNTDWWIV